MAVADAFTCRPPPLDGEGGDDEEEKATQKELTEYWGNGSKANDLRLSDDTME